MGKQGECLKTKSKVLKSDVGCPKQEAQNFKLNLKQLTNTRIAP